MDTSTPGLWAAMEAWQQRRVAIQIVKPRTAAAQMPHLRSFADHAAACHEGEPPIEAVTRDDFELWIGALLATPNPRGGNYSNSTINVKAAPVRGFFADMHHRGIIRIDPCSEVRRLRATPPIPRALPPETIEALMRHARSFRDRTIIEFTLLTGLRMSEVARMRVEHWRPEDQKLWVRRSKSDDEQELWIVGEAEEVLARWVRYGLGGPKSGPMWPSEKGGGPIKADRVGATIQDAAKDAGVSASFHQLRHTFAKRHADGGTRPHVLQKLMGHRSRASTAIYTEANDVDTYLAMVGQQPATVGS